MTDKTIVIVGPTASGKTGLSVELAEKFNGEIISADSRAIYKYMDIGTAKPTPEEQARVPHWGIDLVEPNEQFTVADFKKYALRKIAEIKSRSKQPFLVGGSGLYIDSVIYDYQFGNQADTDERTRLNKLSVQELQECCKNYNIPLPENSQNRRYLMRAIESGRINSDDRCKNYNKDFIVVGITTDKNVLKERIAARAEQMFSEGVVKETTFLAEKYGWGSEAMKSNIYPIAWEWIQGKISREEAAQKFITDDWHLAKKQITWFKRNPGILWLELRDLEEYLEKLLNPNK